MPASDDHEDGRLLSRIAVGDEEAFARIYRRYLPLVLRYCLAQTEDRELAADLAAEVFAAALIAARRYRSDQGPVPAWLLGIARNKLRGSRRRRRIEDRARRRLRLDPAPLTDGDLERVEELASSDQNVLPLVALLPPDQREAVTRRVVEGRSYREIAADLRCSESVVRQRVSRGLRTLRSELEER